MLPRFARVRAINNMTTGRLWCSVGMNGSGGAIMMLAMVDSSFGAASCMGHDSSDDFLGRRKNEQSPQYPIDLVKRVMETGGNTEVSAATPDRPEQVGFVPTIDPQKPAVGGDHIGGEEAVDRQPELANQVPDTTPQCQPADPNRAGVTEAGGEPVGTRGGRVLGGGQAGPRPGCAVLRVDLDRAQCGEVEDDSVVDNPVARRAVASGPHCERHPSLGGQG